MPEQQLPPTDDGDDVSKDAVVQEAGVPVTPKYVSTHDLYPEGYDGSCLRPLGLCELGGCCDTCWYGGKRKED